MLGALLLVAVAVAAAAAPAAWSDSAQPGEARLDDAFAVAVFSSSGQTYSAVGAAGAVQILNVTDPLSPAPVSAVSGQTPGFAGIAGAVDIEMLEGLDSTHAVAADFVNGTVWMIDVTDPLSPTFASSISGRAMGLGAWSPTDVEVLQSPLGPYLLVAASGSDTLHVVNVADPKLPEITSTLSASGLYALADPRDITVFGAEGKTYAVVAAFGDDAILVLDVTNPDAPKWVSRTDHGQGGFNGLSGPESVRVWEVFGKAYAFVAGGGSNVVQVVDMADPQNPTPIGCLWPDYGDPDPPEGAEGIDLITHGSDSYIRDSPNSAVRIPSISDGKTGLIDCTWFGLAERDQVNHPAEMEILETAGGAYLLATGTDGVHVIDITKPWEARFVAFVPDGDGARLEDPYGLAAYAAPGGIYGVVSSFGDDAVQILNVTDPSAPSLAGGLASADPAPGPLWPADTDVFGTFGSAYALVSSARDDTVQIVDVTDPAAPAPLHTIREGPDFGRIEEPGAVETYWDGDRVYGLIAERDSVLVVDVTDPSSPAPVSAIPAAGASALRVGDVRGGPHLLAAVGDAVHAFDLADPAAPAFLSSLDVPPGMSDVELFDVSGAAYAALSFRGHDALYLYGAAPPSGLAAVAAQAEGLEPLWRFGNAETVSTISWAPRSSPEASPTVLLVSLADPASPEILAPWDAGMVNLDDIPDAAAFGVDGRSYLAVVDRFDYEVKVLDVTRPDTLGGLTSQVIDGKSGFDALAKPVRIESTVVAGDAYGIVAGADGRLQILNLTVPWRLLPVDGLAEDLVVPHAEGPRDLEVFTVLDATYVLAARTSYVPYGDAVTILDITMPEIPGVAGGWRGR